MSKAKMFSVISNTPFPSANATLGGGADQIIEGFVGCIYDIRVDGRALDYRTLGQDYMVGAKIGKCNIQVLETKSCLFVDFFLFFFFFD